MVWIARPALQNVSKHLRAFSSCSARRGFPLYLPEIASIARKPRKIWQANEVDRLRDLYSKGHSVQEVADILQRPHGSVKYKCRQVGARKPGRRDWQPDEVDRLRDLDGKGYSLEEIADILQRSYESVKHKRQVVRELKPAHENTQDWRADEDDLLRELTSEGYSLREITNILQRSYNVVAYRRKLHENPKPTRAHVPSPWELPWTNDEITHLRSMIGQNSKDKTQAVQIVAAKLQKSTGSVRKMMKKLDLNKPASKPWTDVEIGILKDMKDYGPNKVSAIKAIAAKLQRSVLNVRRKMTELGLIAARRKWTEEEFRRAIRLRDQGHSYAAIGRALRRPGATVHQRLNYTELRRTSWDQPLPIPEDEVEQIQQLALEGNTIDSIHDVLPHYGKEVIDEVIRRAGGPRARRWQKEELAILRTYAEDNKNRLDTARAATVRLPGRSVRACEGALRDYQIIKINESSRKGRKHSTAESQ